MSITKVYDYNLFSISEDWTVDTLNTKFNISKEKRSLITKLVKINERSLKEYVLDENECLPYIEVKNVDSEKKIIDIKNLEWIALKNMPTRAKYIGRPGDIILSAIRPERGSIAILPDDYDIYAISSNFFVLTPIDIPSELLYFLLSDESVLEEFGALAGGSVIPTMTLKQLKNYQIKHFNNSPQITQMAVKLYKKLKDHIKNITSVTEAADMVFKKELLVFSNANKDIPKFKKIDYSILKDRFDADYLLSVNFPLTEWKVYTKKIKEVVLVENAPCEAIPNEYFRENIPLIQTKDLQDDLIYINSLKVDVVKLGNKIQESNSYLYPIDIVVSKIGGKLSKAAIVPKELKGSISNPNAYVIRNVYNDFLTEYLLLFLKTTMAQEQIEWQMKSTTMKMLKLSMIKELIIPMPSLEIQRNIVEDIKKLVKHSNNNVIEDEISEFMINLFTE